MANTENCPKVGIVMGSDSDMPVMAKAADILEELGIPYEMSVQWSPDWMAKEMK